MILEKQWNAILRRADRAAKAAVLPALLLGCSVMAEAASLWGLCRAGTAGTVADRSEHAAYFSAVFPYETKEGYDGLTSAEAQAWMRGFRAHVEEKYEIDAGPFSICRTFSKKQDAQSYIKMKTAEYRGHEYKVQSTNWTPSEAAPRSARGQWLTCLAETPGEASDFSMFFSGPAFSEGKDAASNAPAYEERFQMHVLSDYGVDLDSTRTACAALDTEQEAREWKSGLIADRLRLAGGVPFDIVAAGWSPTGFSPRNSGETSDPEIEDVWLFCEGSPFPEAYDNLRLYSDIFSVDAAHWKAENEEAKVMYDETVKYAKAKFPKHSEKRGKIHQKADYGNDYYTRVFKGYVKGKYGISTNKLSASCRASETESATLEAVARNAKISDHRSPARVGWASGDALDRVPPGGKMGNVLSKLPKQKVEKSGGGGWAAAMALTGAALNTWAAYEIAKAGQTLPPASMPMPTPRTTTPAPRPAPTPEPRTTTPAPRPTPEPRTPGSDSGGETAAAAGGVRDRYVEGAGHCLKNEGDGLGVGTYIRNTCSHTIWVSYFCKAAPDRGGGSVIGPNSVSNLAEKGVCRAGHIGEGDSSISIGACFWKGPNRATLKLFPDGTFTCVQKVSPQGNVY